MNVKQILIYSVIILILFGAGFATNYFSGRYVDNKLITEYESRVAKYEAATIATNEIIKNLGSDISDLGSELDKRKAHDRDREDLDRERVELDEQWQILNDARASEISRYRDTIQQLNDSEREGTDSLSKLEQYYLEISRRIQSTTKEE